LIKMEDVKKATFLKEAKRMSKERFFLRVLISNLQEDYGWQNDIVTKAVINADILYQAVHPKYEIGSDFGCIVGGNSHWKGRLEKELEAQK